MPQKFYHFVFSTYVYLFVYCYSFQKRYSFAIYLYYSCNICSVAIGTVDKYFVWKSKYNFVYILIPLRHNTSCSPLRFSCKTTTWFKHYLTHMFDISYKLKIYEFQGHNVKYFLFILGDNHVYVFVNKLFTWPSKAAYINGAAMHLKHKSL
jgi:hypothetical protein